MKFHWEAIQRLAKAHHCEDPVADLATFRRFLEFWWCRTYNRPLKDPLLGQYTLDELTYEYLRHLYHEPNMDPRKEMAIKEIESEDEAWVRQMMSQIKQQQAAPAPTQTTEAIPETTSADPVADAPLTPLPPEISTKFDE
jgi:hypothetical protein